MEGGCPEQRYLTVALAGGICDQIFLKEKYAECQREASAT